VNSRAAARVCRPLLGSHCRSRCLAASLAHWKAHLALCHGPLALHGDWHCQCSTAPASGTEAVTTAPLPVTVTTHSASGSAVAACHSLRHSESLHWQCMGQPRRWPAADWHWQWAVGSVPRRAPGATGGPGATRPQCGPRGTGPPATGHRLAAGSWQCNCHSLVPVAVEALFESLSARSGFPLR